MLLALVLSPVLVALPVVLANPAPVYAQSIPAARVQGPAYGFIPAIVEKVLGYGHQIAQWTTGKSDTHLTETRINASPLHCLPHPPRAPVFVNKTIYEVLSNDPKFSKLFKLVNLNNATIELLNSTSSNITFFAPPDSAFPKRHDRGHHHQQPHSNMHPVSTEHDMFADPMSFEDPSEFLLADMLDEVDSLSALDEDHDKKERRRKIIKYIVGAVLSYHVIPQPFDAVTLGQNSTYATNLTLSEGSLDGEPLRLRVGSGVFSPFLAVNLFSRITGPEVFTSNGIVHAVSLPLLPPPAIFTGQFGVPSVFSIATSALQRVGLTDEVDYGYVPPSDDEDKGSMVGANTVTFFAPSNRAFQRLPVRLRLFLFSPFGHRALKKLLQYHIVPSHAVHSDYLHNATDSLSMRQLSGAYSMVPQRAPAAGHPDNNLITLKPAQFQSQVIEFDTSKVYHPSIRQIRQPWSMDKGAKRIDSSDWPGRRRPSPPEVEYNVTVVVPTLLGVDHILTIVKYAAPKGRPRFPRPPIPGSSRTQITVSGGRVALADLPARNGAVHVVDRLLNPLRREHKNHDDIDAEFGHHICSMETDEWEDWEDWLPRWAEES